MPMEIGIFEAKNRLSELVAAVEDGGMVVLTRHGKPVAQLVPYQPDRRAAARQAMDDILRARAAQPRGDIDLEALIKEGRKR